MVTSPNQKTITIQKTEVEKGNGKNKPYLIAYVDIIEAAARDLSNTAFKLYMYLLSNSNGYISAFSPKDVSERYGCSVDSARDAFKTLEAKGYIALEEGMKAKYIFKDKKDTPIASLPTAIAANLQKKKFKDDDTGEIYEMTFKELLAALDNNEAAAKQLWEVA